MLSSTSNIFWYGAFIILSSVCQFVKKKKTIYAWYLTYIKKDLILCFSLLFIKFNMGRVEVSEMVDLFLCPYSFFVILDLLTPTSYMYINKDLSYTIFYQFNLFTRPFFKTLDVHLLSFFPKDCVPLPGVVFCYRLLSHLSISSIFHHLC